jgi:hypothetical protein
MTAASSSSTPGSSSDLVRFQVTGRKGDRELIRSIARRLAEDDPKATRLRGEIERLLAERQAKGGIVAALLRSPLIGAELNLKRSREEGRVIEL